MTSLATVDGGGKGPGRWGLGPLLPVPHPPGSLTQKLLPVTTPVSRDKGTQR